MARITVTTDYCEVIDQFDVSSGNFATTISRAALLDDLREAVEVAERIQMEAEKADA